MRWDEAIAGVDVVREEGPRLVEIYDVQYDSRRVARGDLFVAMRGGTVDGNAYVRSALSRGAVAIVTDSLATFATVRDERPRVPVALVEHGRRALAGVSANLFGHPERELKISAVTGTNGKTTTAFLLAQLLESAGRQCVLIGTVETRIAGRVLESEHTTPESRDLFAIFAEGVKAGCTEVVMEMSSHALEQERVWGVPVDVAMFTNLTQDHLDFHGTMDAYARAKAKLFAGVGTAGPRVAVIHETAEYSSVMREAFTGGELMPYAADASCGEYRAEEVSLEIGDTRFRFVTPKGSVAIESPLSGVVNVENLLAAMCAGLARGLTLEELPGAVKQLAQVPGRFQIVAGSSSQGVTVVVDYAHTDDALRNLIRLARQAVGQCGGKVVTLFGCGGDRDKSKRPKMGRAAGEGSDVVVVTSDNPRSEDPQTIVDEALEGVQETGARFLVELDRRKAIALAISLAGAGDIVLLAGKGHEKTQTFADRTVPFDDVAEAAAVLRSMA